MTDHITTPEISKAPDSSRRLSRKQFNSYLYDLYGCKERNDVTADYVYGGDADDEVGDFYIEVFLNSPAGGTMIALHHGPITNTVDVFTFSERSKVVAEQENAA